MGRKPKGLLPARDTGEPLVVRLVRIATELGFEPAFVGSAEAYAGAVPNLRVIADEPPGIGPLGGLGGLLKAAGARPVIAVACDMPHVSASLLDRLASAPAKAMVVAPRSINGKWEPLCARYDAFAVGPLLTAALARGVRSFQELFESLDLAELPLSAREQMLLEDWDTPEDVSR